MDSSCGPLAVTMSKKIRVIKIAVITEETVPMSKVVAKFCTGPEPYCHNTIPAIKVVKLASIMAEKAAS